MDAGGKLTAADDDAAFPQEEAIAAVQDLHTPSPTSEDDCDDLYGDVSLNFLPLSPRSPSPTSPPKTPSPGRSVLSPSPPPPPAPRGPLPEPQPEPEPERPKPLPTPPRAAKPTQPRHQPRQSESQHASWGDGSPPTTALFIGELSYWTTDEEVEDALAPHGALHGLHFFTDKQTGKSRGFCRADFLHPDEAASAAAALHGHAFHGRHCVASLSCPPELLRLVDDPHVDQAPSGATRGPGNGGNSTTPRGNVGDPPAPSPLPRPIPPRLPQLPFGGMMMGGGGYGGGFAGMGTSMMPSMMAPHVNPAFLAARDMAMGGAGVWYDHRVAGNMWGGQQPWNFGGYGMPRRPQRPQMWRQQLNRNGDYGNVRGTARRERPGGRNEEGGIGNVRRQCGRDGVDLSRKHDHEEGGRYRQLVSEEEREHELQWDESDRYGGDRRYQEYPDCDFRRRGRARSRSQSRDEEEEDEDDHPRKC
uniref:RRM domain-containing protein n=1 Tax=Oryza brachyantha TaxID=4533 RepID=J3LYQ6_ORYBR